MIPGAKTSQSSSLAEPILGESLRKSLIWMIFWAFWMIFGDFWMIFGDSFQGNFCKLHQKTFKNSKNTVFETRWLGALHKKLQKTEKKTVYFLVKLLVLELIVVVLSGQKKVSFFDYFGIYESKLSFNLGKYLFFCPKNPII